MHRRSYFAAIVLASILVIGLEGACFGDVAGQLAEAQQLVESGDYEQAELVYSQIIAQFPDSNEALEAQKQLVFLHIAADQQAQADAAFTELTAGFAGRKDIANAVWAVGLKYKDAKRPDKAEEAHAYNVANFTADKYAMWSQVEIAYSRIERGDYAGADAAADALMSLFAQQKTLHREIHKVAVEFDLKGRKAKAMELWSYNVANFPNTEDAMLSQAQIAMSLIRRDDNSAADAAVDRMLSDFSTWQTFPRWTYQIGHEYARAKRSAKAVEMWNYTVENHPEVKYAIWSQLETALLHIRDGNYTEADTAVERLVSVFSENPELPKWIRRIAEQFAEAGQTARALTLHAFNVESFPQSEEAMASQLDVVDYYLDDANDPNAAVAAAQTLVSVFSGQKGLPGKVYEIAGRLAKAGRPDDAIWLHEYNVDNFPQDPTALRSQVEIAYLNIDKKDPAGIDQAVNDLATGFAGNAALPEAIWSVARKLNGRGHRDKALATHRINIERHRDDKYGMWSQVETIYVYLRDPNAPKGAADAEVAKLLSDFAGQSTISKEVRQVAKEFAKQGKFDKAVQLHEYNIETYPADANAVWSQVDVFQMLVDGNDLTAQDWAAADAAVAELLNRFAGNPELASAVRKAGDIYNARGRPGKAWELWTANVEASPDSVDAMLSQMNIIYTAIDNNDVDDASINAEVEKLLTTFAKQPTLPQRVLDMGARYRDKKDYDRAIQFYKLVNQKWPKTDTALWAAFQTGKIKIRLADHDGVQVVMDKMIADFNDNPDLAVRLACLGDEYFYDKNYPKAIDIWKLVLNDYPGQGPTMIPYLLATGYKRLKDYPTAIAYYKQVLNEFPNSRYADRVPHNLGTLYRERGEYKEAVYWFEKQPELYSNKLLSDWSLYALGIIHLRNLAQPDRALELLTQYLEEFPDGESAHVAPLSLADCCAILGDVPAAIKVLQDGLLKYASDEIGEGYRDKLTALEKGGVD